MFFGLAALSSASDSTLILSAESLPLVASPERVNFTVCSVFSSPLANVSQPVLVTPTLPLYTPSISIVKYGLLSAVGDIDIVSVSETYGPLISLTFTAVSVPVNVYSIPLPGQLYVRPPDAVTAYLPNCLTVVSEIGCSALFRLSKIMFSISGPLLFCDHTKAFNAFVAFKKLKLGTSSMLPFSVFFVAVPFFALTEINLPSLSYAAAIINKFSSFAVVFS